MKMRTGVLTLTVVAAVAGLALAQDHPRGTAAATVGGKKLSVEYGRPALKGRELDALMKQLPADRMWRAGMDQVSTLATEGDLLVGGKRVPAGKYSLYVHAGENGAWDLVLNKDLGLPLGKMWPGAPENMKNEPWPHYQDYTKAIAASEVARVPMAVAKAAQPADMFTMSFTPKGAGQELTLAWGTQAWSVDLQPAK
ncbi:MAG TPA: DUF2911 domain-containing protein [Vicinamibacteria bacterium]|nr:DUF2911 domain-containing protein [Vicinamibacteria bacterium]